MGVLNRPVLFEGLNFQGGAGTGRALLLLLSCTSWVSFAVQSRRFDVTVVINTLKNLKLTIGEWFLCSKYLKS